jgi:hypothetical protein
MRTLAIAAFCPLLLLLTADAPARQKDKDKGTDKNTPKMGETPWFPLQKDTTWTYKLTDGKAESKLVVRVKAHEVVKAKINDKEEDRLCARLEVVVDGRVMEFEHLCVEPDGIYRCSLGGNRPDKALLVLKLPPKKGQTWPVESKIKDETVKGTFTEGEEAKVKVPAGEYEKVVTTEAKDLDLNGLKVSFTEFYAEKVGPIKKVITVGPQKATYELEEFKAGK